MIVDSDARLTILRERVSTAPLLLGLGDVTPPNKLSYGPVEARFLDLTGLEPLR